MADSIVSIINSALIKIGESTIADVAEDRKAARVASRQYEVIRKKLLRQHRWKFSLRRVSLAPDGTPPAFGFENRFAFPSTSLRIAGLFDDNEPQVNYTSSAVPWVVEGKFILADGDEIKIFYVEDITDPTEFDPSFDEALAWALAADIAFDLSTGPQMAEKATKGAAKALRDARTANAMEGWPEIIRSSEWLDSRSQGSRTRIGPVSF